LSIPGSALHVYARTKKALERTLRSQDVMKLHSAAQVFTLQNHQRLGEEQFHHSVRPRSHSERLTLTGQKTLERGYILSLLNPLQKRQKAMGRAADTIANLTCRVCQYSCAWRHEPVYTAMR
jgi:hypothetical protein